MKPIIGIVPAIDEEKGLYYVHEDNIRAIEEAGGTPILIPYYSTPKNTRILHLMDGLYLTGGNDIDPTLFGEEPKPHLGNITRVRDNFEIKIIRKILELEKPILAVCRGTQILNVALGGDMYQDIYSQIETPILQHQQNATKSHPSHFVNIDKNSLLYQLVNETKIKVNSRHHQANRNIAKSLKISGRANDGVIEAIESTDHRFVLGLQWHPENMAVKGDEVSRKIYQGFIQVCKEKGGNKPEHH